MIVQIFDKKWQEFVDLEDSHATEDRVRLRVIAKVSFILEYLRIYCVQVAQQNS